jgi:uncharacterized membrane protein YeaQ/YmgE (transglycosylase-associated protein family)
VRKATCPTTHACARALASPSLHGRTAMSILGTILVGFIVGLIARAVKPGDDKLGLIMTTLLGIAGAFIARYAGMALGFYHEGEPAGWIASVIGAVVLLILYGLVRGRSTRA